jgi:hypothetical protein
MEHCAMKVNYPTEEQIQARAHQIYLERGCEPGHDIDDWLQAEYELMQLPTQKIAELDPSAIEQETASNLRLILLVNEVMSLQRRSGKHDTPFPALG